MATKEEMNKKFFKEEGLKALRNRFGSYVKIYNKNKFPIKVNMLGFGILKIENREALLGRIVELGELIGERYELETETIKASNHSLNKEYKIKWPILE